MRPNEPDAGKNLSQEYRLGGALEIRASDLKDWLFQNAPCIDEEQAHLALPSQDQGDFL